MFCLWNCNSFSLKETVTVSVCKKLKLFRLHVFDGRFTDHHDPFGRSAPQIFHVRDAVDQNRNPNHQHPEEEENSSVVVVDQIVVGVEVGDGEEEHEDEEGEGEDGGCDGTQDVLLRQ